MKGVPFVVGESSEHTRPGDLNFVPFLSQFCQQSTHFHASRSIMSFHLGILMILSTLVHETLLEREIKTERRASVQSLKFKVGPNIAPVTSPIRRLISLRMHVNALQSLRSFRIICMLLRTLSHID